MKRWIILFLILATVVFISSCGGLSTITPEKPLGNIDPNVAVSMGATATTGGAVITTTGAATGNPILILVGGLLTAVGVVLGGYKKKQEAK